MLVKPIEKSSIEIIREKVCILEISSFVGFSIGAEHFYGNLHLGEERAELRRRLSGKEARYLNNKNNAFHLRWKAWDMVNMFNEKESVKATAIKEYKQHFPVAAVLLRGTPVCVDPQEILDAPDFFMVAGTELVEKAKSFGWWDNEKEMKKVCDEWETLLQRL